jgi:hypothetical protein
VTRDDQTNLSVTYGGGIFSGNASDGDSTANCEGGRLVQLHAKRRHHSGHVVGSDTTDGSGHYSIAHRARRHRHRRRRVSFWTTIDPSVVTASNGDTVNCLTARSNTTIRR